MRMMNVILRTLTAETPRIPKRPCAKLNGPAMRYFMHAYFYANSNSST